LVCCAAGLTGVAAAWGVSWVTGTDPKYLTGDPTTSIPGAHFYYGALSTVGLLAWSAAASISLFGAACLYRVPNCRRESHFLFWSGLLSLLLTLDDGLLLHEQLFPYGLHVPEEFVLGGYAVYFLVYVKSFFAELMRSDYLLLVAALAFLASSVLMDQFVPKFALHTFIEDSLKFMGIIFWLAYFAQTTHAILRAKSSAAESNANTTIG
jgi:hypothetical protein